MRILIQSDCDFWSRRPSSPTMLSGCGSYMRTNTYRYRSSYATFASVRKEAGPSSTG